MGVFWQRGRSGRRSPGRLLGHLLQTRYGAAEGMLGAVALVLVVWLLWPEDSGPRLVDERTAWQENVEEAERRRLVLEAERIAKKPFDALSVRSGTAPEAEKPVVVERERRRIARPSELADRLDSFGRRPGALEARRSFQPAPRRPVDASEPAIAADILLQAETESREPSPEAGSVKAALTEVIDNLQEGGSSAGDPPAIAVGAAEDDGAEDGSEEPALDVAVLSSEALDAEPLPEVDLSDLDTLVPLSPVDTAPVDTAPVETAALAARTPDAAPDAAVEPFAVERDADRPAADVRQRPRDDAPTWMKNAVAAAVDDERPIIAVVIDDLGLNRSGTAALNDLPGPLTLAFLPYAGRIEAQTQAAHDAGHELMLHLPMEPVGSDWPGPDALTTRLDQAEFVARLEKNLSRFEGFVGVNNHMGSKLTADSSRMNVVMRELRARDVLFLDSKTSARSVAGDAAGRNGVPNTTRDIFLDHVIDLGAIKRQLARVESVARRTGSAVAIGHPHGATIKALREWLPGLEARGFALAPISAVVARRACSSGVLIAAETCGRYLQARTPADAAVIAKDG